MAKGHSSSGPAFIPGSSQKKTICRKALKSIIAASLKSGSSEGPRQNVRIQCFFFFLPMVILPDFVTFLKSVYSKSEILQDFLFYGRVFGGVPRLLQLAAQNA